MTARIGLAAATAEKGRNGSDSITYPLATPAANSSPKSRKAKVRGLSFEQLAKLKKSFVKNNYTMLRCESPVLVGIYELNEEERKDYL